MNSRPINSYVLAGVGITSILLLANKTSRDKLQTYSTKMKDYFTNKFQHKDLPIHKAGHPDPQDIDDNNMVSEGALYSVNYYNETEQQK